MVLLIGRDDVAQALSLHDVITAVEQAHAALFAGTATQPRRTAVSLPDSTTVMLPMVASVGPHRVAGLKLLTDAPDNVAVGLPRQQSVILVIDPATGAPAAIVDGALVTQVRTAAASAVATKHLANPDACTLGLIGAGNLAGAHVAAISAVRPIERVVVWSRSAESAHRFAVSAADQQEDAIRFEVVEHPRDVVDAADILCTLTPSPTPIVEGDWLHEGMHVNAVGAPPRPDHREIDSAVVARARVVVDDSDVALRESGALLAAIDTGHIRPDHVRHELGDVVVGAVPGRSDRREITLFISVGVPIQDLAAARVVIDAIHRTGRGFHFDLTA